MCLFLLSLMHHYLILGISCHPFSHKSSCGKLDLSRRKILFIFRGLLVLWILLCFVSKRMACDVFTCSLLRVRGLTVTRVTEYKMFYGEINAMNDGQNFAGESFQ